MEPPKKKITMIETVCIDKRELEELKVEYDKWANIEVEDLLEEDITFAWIIQNFLDKVLK